MTVILAAPDLHGEPELVARAAAAGISIVRRCVDAVDLFAAAAADGQAAVVVSGGLPRLEHDVVERLGSQRRVVGVHDSSESADRLRALGVTTIVPWSADVERTLHALRDQCGSVAAPPGVWATGLWEGGVADAEPSTGASPVLPPSGRPVARSGRVVAVWGPAGAPGRTTVALGVAEALMEAGSVVGLVDADTYGPAIALALGLVDDVSGLAVACRHADNATLSPATVLATGHRIRDDWYVLGGVGRPERWADLRPAALDTVWSACRSTFDVTVIDVGFCLEADDGGAWSHRRNAAALSAMGAADAVLAVADSSALGAARLVTAWPGAAAAAPMAQVTVVQNRVRRGRHGPDGQWSRGIRDLGVLAPVHPLPTDPRAAQRCWAGARSLGETARRSPLRKALITLARNAVSR